MKITKQIQIKKTKYVDNFGRPIYKSDKGTIFKDTNCGNSILALAVAYGLESEPEYPVELEKFEIIN